MFDQIFQFFVLKVAAGDADGLIMLNLKYPFPFSIYKIEFVVTSLPFYVFQSSLDINIKLASQSASENIVTDSVFLVDFSNIWKKNFEKNQRVLFLLLSI